MPLTFRVRVALVVMLAAVRLSLPARADQADDQYAVAAGFYTQRRWDLAAEEFQTFLKEYSNHPKSNLGVFYLAEALLQLGKPDQAASQFRKYLAAQPEGKFARPALFRAGEASYLANESDVAKAELEKFLAKYPGDPLNAYVLPYLGNIALDADNPAVAENHFRRALAAFPQGRLQDESRLGLAQALERQGKNEEAERFFLAVAGKTGSPRADDAQFHLGALQYASGKFDAAIETFQAFESEVSQSPWRPTARMGRGWALLKLGRLDEAAAAFDSIKSDPKLGIEARYWLGLTQKAQKDWQAATKTLLEAAVLDPKHELVPAMRFHAGDVMVHAADMAAAEKQFDQVIASAAAGNQWLDDAARGKVQTALYAKDYQRVDHQVAGFLAQFPQSPLKADVLQLSARSLIERKQYERAIAALKPVLADGNPHTQDLQAQYLSSLCYEGLKRQQEALKALQPVLKSATGQLLADARLTQSSLLLVGKRFDEAIPPLEAFLAIKPTGEDGLKGRGQLAICYARTGQFDKAKQVYSELVAENPNHELVLETTEQLAEAAIDAGETAWSGQLFASLGSAARSPDYIAKGQLGLGWSQYKSGQLEEAAATFERLLAKHPKPSMAAEAALVRGKILQKLDRKDPALAMYDQVIGQYPTSPQFSDALWEAARLRDQLKQYDKAAELYQRLANHRPQFSQIDAVLYQWAWVLSELRRTKESGALFARLRAEHPDSRHWGHATLTLAIRAFEAKDYGRARGLVTELLARKPDAAILDQVVYLEGQIAYAEKKWEEAAKAFNRLLADCPESEHRLAAEYGIADVALQRNDYQAATERFQRLSQKTQGNEQPLAALIRLRLAQSLSYEKQWDEALAVASRIGEEYPGFEEQYEADYVIGRCLANKADFEAARRAYEEVIYSPQGEKTQTAAKAQLMIAESYYHQKNYEEAFRAYLRLEILYDYPDLQAAAVFQAAKCRELLGEWEDAAKLYTKLLKTYPDSDWVNEASGRLEAVSQRMAGGSVP